MDFSLDQPTPRPKLGPIHLRHQLGFCLRDNGGKSHRSTARDCRYRDVHYVAVHARLLYYYA